MVGVKGWWGLGVGGGQRGGRGQGVVGSIGWWGSGRGLREWWGSRGDGGSRGWWEYRGGGVEGG